MVGPLNLRIHPLYTSYNPRPIHQNSIKKARDTMKLPFVCVDKGPYIHVVFEGFKGPTKNPIYAL